MSNLPALPADTLLAGDFRIIRVLGAGGFGITYLAEETALARQVTIKEYFPTEFAARGADSTVVARDEEAARDFKWGLDRFIEEAQTLARFDHPNIVRVYRYFRANETAYMVLGFEEGQSLKAWLKSLGRAPRQREIDAIVAPLLNALETLHAADFLHRDIAPDNIIIRTDGTPVLIDFGSARGEIATRSRTVSALVKPGYSPYEQYAETGHRQGAWTDIYALAATLYQAITGKRPPDAPSRVVKDELISARDAALSSYRPRFLAAIDRALALDIGFRPQSVAAWRGDLLAPEAAKTRWLGLGSAGGDDAIAKTRALPQQDAGSAVPPPPDVPGRQGGLIEYIEKVKNKGKAAQPSAAAAKPAGDASPKPAKAERKGRAVALAAGKSQLPVAAAPARLKRVAPKPRAVRGASGWRSLAIKLGIGAVIAGLAVQIDTYLPRSGTPASRGASVVTGAVREPVAATFIAGHRGGTRAVAFSDDGRSIVTTGADGAVKLWNASSGTLMWSRDVDGGAATALSVMGRRALTASASGQVALWDLDRGERIGAWQHGPVPIWAVAFAGDTGHAVTAGQDGTVSLWDMQAGGAAPIMQFEGHDGPAYAVAFARTGAFIASGGADRTVRLWNPTTLGLIRVYRGHRDAVTAVAFSPDGKLMASGSADGGVRLWSTSSQRLFRVLSGHRGRVAGLAFAPDGSTLLSTGEDGAVRVWDFRRSRAPLSVQSGASGISAAAFSPDGRRMAIASREGDVRLAEATPAKRVRE